MSSHGLVSERCEKPRVYADARDDILWVMGNRRMRKPEEVVDEKLGEAGMIKQNLT